MPRRDPLARARNRPRPEEWRDDELMTLAEAAAVFWPDGPLTVRSLRTEIAKGSLTAERIAGKVFVTPAALKEMRSDVAPGEPSATLPPRTQGTQSNLGRPQGNLLN